MDPASQQLLRKLCNGEPEKYSMENLFKMIREYVVRTDSLQQRRITQMLNFRQRQGEPFSQTLCRFEETEKDVDVENYTVEEMRAHLRVAACLDGKLKEELLKLGQPGNSNEPAEPLTSEAIWHATRNYEQRQKCLRSETDDVAVSSVSAPTRAGKTKKFCRTCAVKCGWDREEGKFHDHCYGHRDTKQDASTMECTLQYCNNPEGDHNTQAHKKNGADNKNYKSNPSPPKCIQGETIQEQSQLPELLQGGGANHLKNTRETIAKIEKL